MNMTMAIGVYAAITRELGRPLSFPGGDPFVTQATDAYLLGRAVKWAAESPVCGNETFNITNGDELVWRSAWPAIADVFGMEVGPDTPTSLAESMPEHESTWQGIVEQYGLQHYSMSQLLGASWQFADAVFGLRGGQNTLLSRIKARRFGFSDCIDTEQMFALQLRRLQSERILPP